MANQSSLKGMLFWLTFKKLQFIIMGRHGSSSMRQLVTVKQRNGLVPSIFLFLQSENPAHGMVLFTFSMELPYLFFSGNTFIYTTQK